MSLPTKQKIKGDIVRLLTRARNQGRLDQLTVRIVIRELAEQHGIEENVLQGEKYKPFIKNAVVATMHSFNDASDGGADGPENMEDDKSDGSATASKRKRVIVHSPKEEPAEDADASECEAASSKKASARSKSSKGKDRRTANKPAKSGRTSKKLESETQYKSKAMIESSDEEAPPESGRRKSAGSPKKGKTPRKPSSPKPKQHQKAVKDDSDIEMDTAGGPKPSSSTSKPMIVTESPKRTNSKAEESARDPMESELSSVIDEPPTKRKKQAKEPAKPPNDEKVKRGKKKELLSKDEETVIKLKGMVLACGVRKVWKKEFEGLDKPSQQIKRLHSILGDLGMTPRYSMEKAKAIREERELAQELKDVQEFDKATKRHGRGQPSSPQSAESMDEDDDANIPVRKKQNARASIMAFLQDQSGEE